MWGNCGQSEGALTEQDWVCARAGACCLSLRKLPQICSALGLGAPGQEPEASLLWGWVQAQGLLVSVFP